VSVSIETIRAVRWKQNCYLVRDGGEALVIDPGADVADIEAAIGGARLVGILCTHAHYDHVAAAAALCVAHGVPCWVHERDRRLLAQAPVYALRFEQLSLAIPDSVETFGGGAAFAVGGSALQAIETPGHTPGSVTFQLGSDLFTGDTLLRERAGRTDLPGGDGATLRASVGELLGRDGAVRILPGHGGEWNVADARAWWRG